MITETNNTKNCRTCNKSTVCKYSDEVVEKVEKMIEYIKEYAESFREES